MERSIPATKPPVDTISVSELHARLHAVGGDPIHLIDVRTGAEFGGSHVAGAHSMPLGQLSAESVHAARAGAAGAPLYVMCRSGQRSRRAVEQLRGQGVEGAVGIEGGLLAWEAAGLPVERGAHQVMSLERQVRIAAGTLVVLGAVLGTWVHAGFYGLGAFVGAGLVWAFYYSHWPITEEPGNKLAVFCTAPAIRNLPSNFFCEVIATFVLVVVAAALSSKRLAPAGVPPGMGPVLVGGLVWSIGLSLGGTTGYAINPARDFPPRLAHALLPIPGKGSSDWSYAWVPVVGPLCGAILAALFVTISGLK